VRTPSAGSEDSQNELVLSLKTKSEFEPREVKHVFGWFFAPLPPWDASPTIVLMMVPS
jgi:hypothetical protein